MNDAGSDTHGTETFQSVNLDVLSLGGRSYPIKDLQLTAPCIGNCILCTGHTLKGLRQCSWSKSREQPLGEHMPSHWKGCDTYLCGCNSCRDFAACVCQQILKDGVDFSELPQPVVVNEHICVQPQTTLDQAALPTAMQGMMQFSVMWMASLLLPNSLKDEATHQRNSW